MLSRKQLSEDETQYLFYYFANILNEQELDALFYNNFKVINNESTNTKKENKNKKESLSSKSSLEYCNKKEKAIKLLTTSKKKPCKLKKDIIFFYGKKINIQKILKCIFNDQVKLLDMLLTDSFPSQIEAFYRTNSLNFENSINVGEIILSDNKHKLILKDGGFWDLETTKTILKKYIKDINETYRKHQFYNNEKTENNEMKY